MIYYFAYGMNTNQQQMAHRCPAAKLIGPAVLPGYRFRFAHHADIVPDENFSVEGVLWYITEDCLKSLDALEGYPHYYDCQEVLVKCEGEDYFAEVYYMTPGKLDALPSANYYKIVMEGYQQHGVNTRQITQFLESWQTVDNPLTSTLF